MYMCSLPGVSEKADMDDVMGGGASFSQLEHADDALEAYATAADSLPDLTYKVRLCEWGLVERVLSLEVRNGLFVDFCSIMHRSGLALGLPVPPACPKSKVPM